MKSFSSQNRENQIFCNLNVFKLGDLFFSLSMIELMMVVLIYINNKTFL